MIYLFCFVVKLILTCDLFCFLSGCVSYDGKVLTVGGEDDKSWMAGLCWLQEDSSGQEVWMEGQELPTVMSTFGCVVANLINQLNFT